MANLKALVFVKNDFIGDFQYEAHNALPFAFLSRAYFCPACGEVWARVVVSHEVRGAYSFYPFYSACSRHGSILQGAGSLIDHMAVTDFMHYWPASVWSRELQLWAEQVPNWSFSPQE